MERIKAIVDYALDGNLTEMRDALHAEMLDRVQLTLEGLKKIVAQNLVLPEEKEDDEDDKDEDDKDDKKSKKDGDDDDDDDDEKKKEKSAKNESVESLDETPETKPKKVVQGSAPAGTFAAAKAAGKFKALNKKFGDPNKKPKKVVGEEAEQIDELNDDTVKSLVLKRLQNVNKTFDSVHSTARYTPAAREKVNKDYKTAQDKKNKMFGLVQKRHARHFNEAEQIDEKNWIAGAIKHKGSLHRELGVPEGKKIPEKELEKAEHAGGKEGKRARLAATLKKMH